MRQHVNPLSRFFQLPRELLGPDELFERPHLPIHLDIGSARGQFLLDLAVLQPTWNFLGVEIRHALVMTADRERERLGLTNLRYLFCNANVSLEKWLLALPKGQLKRVSIQFPDPWFKRRHKKRRVLQPRFLLGLTSAMQPGCELFVQSDLLEVIEPMRKLIELSNCFECFHDDGLIWLKKNPFDMPTEREEYVLSRGFPVYRCLYKRNGNQPFHLLSLEESWQCIDSKTLHEKNT